MTLLIAVALWCFHGVLLWWNWGAFRPRIAALHGVGMGVAAGVLVWLGAPGWAVTAAGVLIGAVGGWGHRLAPGLWVGLALLCALPFLIQSGQALMAVAAFALAAQVAAGLASLTKGAL